MIAVCDVNTIWRHRPFDAMACHDDVVGFAPHDGIVTNEKQEWAHGQLDVARVWLPPSWASKTACLGQRLLWQRIQAEAGRRNLDVECVVVTSPHYITLLGLLPEHVKSVYYASDDYRSYEGWNNMAELEMQMVRRVDHSFFISDALAQRARDEYGVEDSKISTSMNGTEGRFFPAEGEELPLVPPTGELPRPIAGVVGGIGDRLDFDLLRACADLPEIGTLLLVGPLPDSPTGDLKGLLDHPKCVGVNTQPHDTIHQWFKCLDVGLMPYVSSEFNRFCSPMRLFDHLASGQPIVATSACAQAEAFKSQIEVCDDRSEFIDALKKVVSHDYQKRIGEGLERAEKQAWSYRADNMLRIISAL